ncbi:hypothetical protein V8D89_007004 [Ganoderma adspersum]
MPFSVPIRGRHCTRRTSEAAAFRYALTSTLPSPLALYWCCIICGTLLDGWKREDDTAKYLCAGDLNCCFNVGIRLIQEQSLSLSRIFNCAVPPERCRNLGHAAREIHGDEGHALVVDLASWLRNRVGLCGGCKEFLLEQTKTERRRVGPYCLAIQ